MLHGSNKSFQTKLINAPKLVKILILCFLLAQTTNGQHFHNEWAVEIIGDENNANEVADAHGFINMGKILQSGNFYRFSHPHVSKRSLESSSEHHLNLVSHEKVAWAEQQVAKVRRKRDLVELGRSHFPNDPLWGQTWYLLPSKKPSMRVVEAWERGFTGKNVAVTILDDGIEYTHPDLEKNYYPGASGDINGNDDDPIPRLNPSDENKHGTRCAGEVAAQADNGVCSVGVAYNARIGGVRMLDGPVTDAVEAASIGLKPQNVDIYSASWGPDDDGRTVDGPARLAKIAFEEGVKLGRGGRGSIFVWASGNGGRHEDNCNCDGYTNSIFTLSISSTTESKKKPWYSESCSSTLAATYSSGTFGEKQVVTTDLRHRCTNKHTGTSASAPLAGGICALALEANGDLTWRDMQHLVVRTARSEGLESDWKTNAVGRPVSHSFGYGLMDALGMVDMATNWTLVPKQHICNISVISPEQPPRIFSSGNTLRVPVLVSSCDDGGVMVDRLEHVQAVLTLRNQRRGDLTITLTSPLGTRSTLLGRRHSDMSTRGFTKWPFMTTHSWDEDPRGTWILEIKDSNTPTSGTLSGFNLILHGTVKSDWGIPTPKDVQLPDEATDSPQQVEPTAPPSVATTPSPSAHVVENCEIELSSEPGCLVCSAGFALSGSKCVASCEVGHYAVQEGGGLVCRGCPSFCHSCAGSRFIDCVQCVSGARMGEGNRCFPPEPPPTPTRVYYMVAVSILALAFLCCAIIFVINKRRSASSGDAYKYIPSEDGAISRLINDSGLEYYDDLDEYKDNPVKVATGGRTKRKNGHVVRTPGKSPLLDHEGGF